MNEDAEPARQLAEARKALVVFLGHDGRHETGAIDLHDIRHLGREHIVGPALFGLGDQRCRRADIGLRHPRRTHLDETDPKGRNLVIRRDHGRSSFLVREQRIEPACLFERIEIIAAADMGRSDENLRDQRAAVGASDHLGPGLRVAGDVDLGESDTLATQQVLRGSKSLECRSRQGPWRPAGGVRCAMPHYMGARAPSTTWANTRTSTLTAPARSRVRAHASIVAPDVRTSSMRMSRRPTTSARPRSGTWNAP